jgi:RNA ligase (TIGR02306 family)
MNGKGGVGVIRGDCEGCFPDFIRKTDQERIQNMHRWVMSHYLGMEFETTLKIDGTSLTAFYYQREGEDLKTGVCSRNWNLKEDTEERKSQYWEIVKKTGLMDALREIKRNIAVQAELMGPGIQKNREKLEERKFFVFDIWDIDHQRYMTPYERIFTLGELSAKGLILGDNMLWGSVPLIEYVTIDESWTLQKFLAYAERPSINHPIGEGVVWKSVKPNGPSFKVISNAFLLKQKD